MEPFHDSGDVYKAQKHDVELVKAGGATAKDLHALEEVFNQMACLVAVLVQDAWVPLAVHPAGDDDLHTALFCGLDDLVAVISFVGHKRPGLHLIEQFGHGFGVVANFVLNYPRNTLFLNKKTGFLISTSYASKSIQ